MSCFMGQMKEYELVSLDRFDGTNLRSTVYFLSHLHEDHTRGLAEPIFHRRLNSNKNIFLYCSEVTKILIEASKKYSHLTPFVKTLAIDTPTTIEIPDPLYDEKETVTVTMLPAFHCPGSVMCLLEGNEGTVLYTGDFRWEHFDLEQMHHLRSGESVKKIKSVYIDTTFCTEENLYIPSRQQCIDAVYHLVHDWTSQSPQHVVYFFLRAQYGHEPLLNAVASRLGKPVHVSKHKAEVYDNISELHGNFTADGTSTQIHACPNNMLVKLDDDTQVPCRQAHDDDKVLLILPTTMYFTQFQNLTLDKIIRRINVRFYRACYSFHSSYTEVKDLLAYLKPDNVYPNVKPPNDANLIVTQQRLTRMLSDCHSATGHITLVDSQPEEPQQLGTLKRRKRQAAVRRKDSKSDTESLDFGSPSKALQSEKSLSQGSNDLKKKRGKASASLSQPVVTRRSTRRAAQTTSAVTPDSVTENLQVTPKKRSQERSVTPDLFLTPTKSDVSETIERHSSYAGSHVDDSEIDLCLSSQTSLELSGGDSKFIESVWSDGSFLAAVQTSSAETDDCVFVDDDGEQTPSIEDLVMYISADEEEAEKKKKEVDAGHDEVDGSTEKIESKSKERPKRNKKPGQGDKDKEISGETSGRRMSRRTGTKQTSSATTQSTSGSTLTESSLKKASLKTKMTKSPIKKDTGVKGTKNATGRTKKIAYASEPIKVEIKEEAPLSKSDLELEDESSTPEKDQSMNKKVTESGNLSSNSDLKISPEVQNLDAGNDDIGSKKHIKIVTDENVEHLQEEGKTTNVIEETKITNVPFSTVAETADDSIEVIDISDDEVDDVAQSGQKLTGFSEVISTENITEEKEEKDGKDLTSITDEIVAGMSGTTGVPANQDKRSRKGPVFVQDARLMNKVTHQMASKGKRKQPVFVRDQQEMSQEMPEIRDGIIIKQNDPDIMEGDIEEVTNIIPKAEKGKQKKPIFVKDQEAPVVSETTETEVITPEKDANSEDYTVDLDMDAAFGDTKSDKFFSLSTSFIEDSDEDNEEDLVVIDEYEMDSIYSDDSFEDRQEEVIDLTTKEVIELDDCDVAARMEQNKSSCVKKKIKLNIKGTEKIHIKVDDTGNSEKLKVIENVKEEKKHDVLSVRKSKIEVRRLRFFRSRSFEMLDEKEDYGEFTFYKPVLSSAEAPSLEKYHTKWAFCFEKGNINQETDKAIIEEDTFEKVADRETSVTNDEFTLDTVDISLATNVSESAKINVESKDSLSTAIPDKKLNEDPEKGGKKVIAIKLITEIELSRETPDKDKVISAQTTENISMLDDNKKEISGDDIAEPINENERGSQESSATISDLPLHESVADNHGNDEGQAEIKETVEIPDSSEGTSKTEPEVVNIEDGDDSQDWLSCVKAARLQIQKSKERISESMNEEQDCTAIEDPSTVTSLAKDDTSAENVKESLISKENIGNVDETDNFVVADGAARKSKQVVFVSETVSTGKCDTSDKTSGDNNVTPDVQNPEDNELLTATKVIGAEDSNNIYTDVDKCSESEVKEMPLTTKEKEERDELKRQAIGFMCETDSDSDSDDSSPPVSPSANVLYDDYIELSSGSDTETVNKTSNPTDGDSLDETDRDIDLSDDGVPGKGSTNRSEKSDRHTSGWLSARKPKQMSKRANQKDDSDDEVRVRKQPRRRETRAVTPPTERKGRYTTPSPGPNDANPFRAEGKMNFKSGNNIQILGKRHAARNYRNNINPYHKQQDKDDAETLQGSQIKVRNTRLTHQSPGLVQYPSVVAQKQSPFPVSSPQVPVAPPSPYFPPPYFTRPPMPSWMPPPSLPFPVQSPVPGIPPFVPQPLSTPHPPVPQVLVPPLPVSSSVIQAKIPPTIKQSPSTSAAVLSTSSKTNWQSASASKSSNNTTSASWTPFKASVASNFATKSENPLQSNINFSKLKASIQAVTGLKISQSSTSAAQTPAIVASSSMEVGGAKKELKELVNHLTEVKHLLEEATAVQAKLEEVSESKPDVRNRRSNSQHERVDEDRRRYIEERHHHGYSDPEREREVYDWEHRAAGRRYEHDEARYRRDRYYDREDPRHSPPPRRSLYGDYYDRHYDYADHPSHYRHPRHEEAEYRKPLGHRYERDDLVPPPPRRYDDDYPPARRYEDDYPPPPPHKRFPDDYSPPPPPRRKELDEYPPPPPRRKELDEYPPPPPRRRELDEYPPPPPRRRELDEYPPPPPRRKELDEYPPPPPRRRELDDYPPPPLRRDVDDYPPPPRRRGLDEYPAPPPRRRELDEYSDSYPPPRSRRYDVDYPSLPPPPAQRYHDSVPLHSQGYNELQDSQFKEPARNPGLDPLQRTDTERPKESMPQTLANLVPSSGKPVNRAWKQGPRQMVTRVLSRSRKVVAVTSTPTSTTHAVTAHNSGPNEEMSKPAFLTGLTSYQF